MYFKLNWSEKLYEYCSGWSQNLAATVPQNEKETLCIDRKNQVKIMRISIELWPGILTHHNLWDSAKEVLTGKFIALNVNIRKERLKVNDLSFHLKKNNT